MVFTSCQNLEVQPSKTCLWQIYFLIQQTNCNSQILTQLSLDQSNSYLLSHISWHKMLTVEQILIPSSMEQHVGRTELLPECHNMHTELSTTGNLRHYLQLPTFSDSEWQYSLPASCRNFPSGATAWMTAFVFLHCQSNAPIPGNVEEPSHTESSIPAQNLLHFTPVFSITLVMSRVSPQRD